VGENKKYAAALIVPDADNLRVWCKNRNLNARTLQEMIANKEVVELFKKEVKNFNTFFGDYEQIKNFRLIADDWTADNFLSQTLKVKRKKVEQHYQKEIEELFA